MSDNSQHARDEATPAQHDVVVVKPPAPADLSDSKSVFLAGSIEMGKAIDWQSLFTSALEEAMKNQDCRLVIANPRRDDWNTELLQSIHEPRLKEQVDWELDCLDKTQVIAMFFDKDTKSPITLLELGLYARSGRMVVYCPHGYFRKGNVDIVCARFGVPFFDEHAQFESKVLQMLDVTTQPNRRTKMIKDEGDHGTTRSG